MELGMQHPRLDPGCALLHSFCPAGLEQRRQVSLALADAGAVWPGDSRIAFLVVEQYLFFPTSRRRFGLEGRSLLEINRYIAGGACN
jgi:hypothetical protein